MVRGELSRRYAAAFEEMFERMEMETETEQTVRTGELTEKNPYGGVPSTKHHQGVFVSSSAGHAGKNSSKYVYGLPLSFDSKTATCRAVGEWGSYV